MSRINRKGLKARDKNGHIQQPQFCFLMSVEERQKVDELRAADVNISEILRRCINEKHAAMKGKV
jgi:hypothetical protein